MTQQYQVVAKLETEELERFKQLEDMNVGTNHLLQQVIAGMQNMEKFRREIWIGLGEKYGFDPADPDLHINIPAGEFRKFIKTERVEYIAQLCHEINRAYCASLGDDSQLAWADAPQWQKDSAIAGVNFQLNNDASPEQQHENWKKDKIADGWRYGPVKDPERKEHPCMVPYEDLPESQKAKDYLFKAIVDFFKAQQ